MYRILLLCLIVASAAAQPLDTLMQIDQLFSSWNNATPGGMVQIKRGERIIYNKAFGMADLEHNTPNTIETISESGSVAKQFTAMAALLLVSEGKISLSDDVKKFIPELPNYAAVITVHQLLNHTSGLKDWGVLYALTGWPRSTRAYTNEAALRIICRQQSTNFIPGTEYSYSNSNYVLLSYIVERVSGQSLTQFTEERFFQPLEMNHTKWRSNFREIIPNRAIAYDHTKEGFEQLMPFENAHGPGGLLTTTSDLLKWNTLLEHHSIGGDEVFQWRIQKGKLKNGKEIGYASGLFIDTYNNLQKISHTGATAGYRALLSYYPQKKLAIAILSNDSWFDAGGIDKKIATLYLGSEKTKSPATAPISASESDLKKFEGTFKSVREYDIIKLSLKKGKLLLNEKPTSVIHKDTVFENGTKWAFVNSSTIIAVHSDTSSYKRVLPPSKVIDEYTGNYYSEEVETNYSITRKANELFLTIGAFPPLRLSPEMEDGFMNNSNLYEFKRDKRGEVTSLEVNMSRCERVLFKKKKF
jgi:CubicO group peptidase (beta-lactamase class C family)